MARPRPRGRGAPYDSASPSARSFDSGKVKGVGVESSSSTGRRQPRGDSEGLEDEEGEEGAVWGQPRRERLQRPRSADWAPWRAVRHQAGPLGRGRSFNSVSF